MSDREFDALLTAACGEVRQEDLDAAGMGAPAGRPCRLLLRAAWIAAACLMLCAGASAAWPKLLLTLQGNTITMEAADAEQDSGMADAHKPVFGYMPKGYTVVWDENENGEEWKTYSCSIYKGTVYKGKVVNRKREFGGIEQACLFSRPVGAKTSSMYYEVEEGAEVPSEELARQAYEETLVLESIEDLTLEDLKTYRQIVWTDGGNTYTLWCLTLNREALFDIIKGIA